MIDEAAGPAMGEVEKKPLEPCTVLDPFAGSGATGVAACQLDRDFIGIELNPDYAAMAEKRIGKAMRPATHRTDDVIESPLFAVINA